MRPGNQRGASTGVPVQGLVERLCSGPGLHRHAGHKVPCTRALRKAGQPLHALPARPASPLPCWHSPRPPAVMTMSCSADRARTSRQMAATSSPTTTTCRGGAGRAHGGCAGRQQRRGRLRQAGAWRGPAAVSPTHACDGARLQEAGSPALPCPARPHLAHPNLPCTPASRWREARHTGSEC